MSLSSLLSSFVKFFFFSYYFRGKFIKPFSSIQQCFRHFLLKKDEHSSWFCVYFDFYWVFLLFFLFCFLFLCKFKFLVFMNNLLASELQNDSILISNRSYCSPIPFIRSSEMALQWFQSFHRNGKRTYHNSNVFMG